MEVLSDIIKKATPTIFLKIYNMASTETNTTIIDGFVHLLENLSPDNKLDLISKLTASLKASNMKTVLFLN